jgi:hypothetical protein
LCDVLSIALMKNKQFNMCNERELIGFCWVSEDFPKSLCWEHWCELCSCEAIFLA